jgi:radical SAM superfamily enzyme YgiQ (UPF0313 family)
MKVILVRPPEDSGVKTEFISVQYPINLGYLSAYLKERGISTEIWDYCVEKYSKDELAERVRIAKPDIVGVTAVTSTVIPAHEIAAVVKETDPSILTLVGGSHVTALPAETLNEFPKFDVVVMGEGEETLFEICSAIKNGESLGNTVSVAYRKNGESIVKERRPLIKDIDSLPFPDRDAVSLSLYKRSHANRGISRKFLNIAELLVSRGCPYSCIFCAGHINYQSKVRFRSAENVKKEIELCIERYSVNHFTIQDDTFTLRSDLVYAICDVFKSHKVTWDCNARVNTVTYEMMQKMADSGCVKVSMGVESGSPRILELLKKGTTPEQIRKAFAAAHKSGIKLVEGTFIIGGHPSETLEDVEQTKKLMKEIEPDAVSVSTIVPFPGTEVYRIMKEGGYIGELSWNKFVLFGATPSWRTEHFSAEELVRIQKQALREFYMRPKYIMKMLSKIRSADELFYWMDAGAGFVKHVVMKA